MKKRNKIAVHRNDDIAFQPGTYIVSNSVGYVQGPCELKRAADVFKMFDSIEDDDVFTYYPVNPEQVMVGRVSQSILID